MENSFLKKKVETKELGTDESVYIYLFIGLHNTSRLGGLIIIITLFDSPTSFFVVRGILSRIISI